MILTPIPNYIRKKCNSQLNLITTYHNTKLL